MSSNSTEASIFKTAQTTYRTSKSKANIEYLTAVSTAQKACNATIATLRAVYDSISSTAKLGLKTN